jgi:cell volume regulation protein A
VTPSLEQLLLVAALLLFVAVGASKVSGRLGIPSLLLFLAIGMLAGSDGPGGIWFDNAWLAQSLGVVALALILFAGGLETKWGDTAPVLWQALSLATLGVALTALVIAGFAKVVLGFSLLEGLLLGAIVSSTDAAAVFSVLRAQRVALRGRLQPLLELESGSNDPMAVFLTVAFTALLAAPPTSVLSLVPMFAQQMALGAVLGLVIGKAAVGAVNRLRLDSEGLYPVFTLAVAAFSYSVTAYLGGSGFLAIYLVGLVMGNSDFLHKRSLIRFHNGLAWLMQISMFLALGLLVFPSRLPAVAGAGALLALCLVFVARPISVFVSLALAPLGVRQKLLIAWVGLRGAVPIVLATFPLVAGLGGADRYFNVVFFIVIASVLLQGTTLGLVSRWLGLQSPAAPKPVPPLEFAPSSRASSDLLEMVVPRASAVAGAQILNLHLPKSALLVLLTRGENYIIPRGGTILEPGDTVLVLAEREDLPAVRAILEKPADQATTEGAGGR